MKQLLIFFFLMLMACNPQQRQIDALKAEIMHLHDVETMPKMGELVQTARELRTLREQIYARDSTQMESLVAIDLHVQKIEQAEDAMMDWMRNFRLEPEGKNGEELLKYFQTEKERITSVKTLMLESLDEGQVLKEKYGK